MSLPSIYVLGSNTFMKEMVATAEELNQYGVKGWIHPNYVAMVNGEMAATPAELSSSEHAEVKRQYDYLKVHYQHILESDAVLIVNNVKNGIDNYVGGNALIEMGQAYVNNKKIFLKYDLPTTLSYAAEIECMDPICLQGDISQIVQYF